MFIQYLSESGRRQLIATIEAAGRAATREAPLAWLRMEPANRTFEVRLTTWPGGTERLLATAGGHGKGIHWFG